MSCGNTASTCHGLRLGLLQPPVDVLLQHLKRHPAHLEEGLEEQGSFESFNVNALRSGAFQDWRVSGLKHYRVDMHAISPHDAPMQCG